MKQSLTTRLSNIAGIVIAIIIILLPFHEFLSNWTASNYNHYDLIRLWKEVLLVIISPAVIYIAYKTKPIKDWLSRDILIKLIALFILLNLLSGFWALKTNRVSKTALAEGLVIDLRFLIFFVFCAIVSYKATFLKRYWQKLLLLPAVGVIVFGLTQLFLPINFLRHFGYGPNTSPAYETVDQNSKFHRIQSTLRGANPLGAYLILTTTAAAVKLKNHKIFKLLFILASLITLFFTYSRSAYIGLAISLVVLYYIIKLHKHLQKKFVLICACAVIVLALGVTLLRHNSTAEDFFFHTSNTSKSSQSSNSVRFSDLSSGIKDVVKQPLGGGTGTAGPASAHNNHPARLAENYYIQIAQESGILGFVIFISINFIVGLRLWKNQDDPMAAVLFASLIGISFVNMLSHAWSDDTLSLLWWGMAGIMLSPVIIKTNKTKKINNETNKNKSTKVI